MKRSLYAAVHFGAACIVGVGFIGCSSSEEPAESITAEPASLAVNAADRTAALDAFDVVYEVLQHPRCMNCHPAGDRPLQFDNSEHHIMNVQRGDDDAGRPGMRCVTCHGSDNLDAPHLPPGVSTVWKMAPREMVFEGLSKRELSEMLLDPARSHMTTDEMIEHVTHDALVLWGWDPGPGRTPVDVPHEDFVDAFTRWVEAGAPVPGEDTP
ncbi:MAG: hypothetical protein AAF432_02400 [Planctomycetota bacterium]